MRRTLLVLTFLLSVGLLGSYAVGERPIGVYHDVFHIMDNAIGADEVACTTAKFGIETNASNDTCNNTGGAFRSFTPVKSGNTVVFHEAILTVGTALGTTEECTVYLKTHATIESPVCETGIETCTGTPVFTPIAHTGTDTCTIDGGTSCDPLDVEYEQQTVDLGEITATGSWAIAVDTRHECDVDSSPCATNADCSSGSCSEQVVDDCDLMQELIVEVAYSVYE